MSIKRGFKTTGKATTRTIKLQEKQQEDFKRPHESIDERQEEKYGKLLECFTKENDPNREI